ncbi:MAG: M48 family metalloprotease [Candidatus Methanoperedens sp.]|nr:M48 family metalloprotease [Candidatus Methanoperedens sp.]MCZ7406683.1 M48 family metalloprotease [Candidatus Methanoperedens sp.]
MNISGELNCIGLCLKLSDFAPIVALLVVISISLLAASLMLKKPKQKLMTFVSAQILSLMAIAATFYLMKCDGMLTLYVYLAYVIISIVLIFGVLRYYDRILIKRLDAKPAASMMEWVEGFVGRFVTARVYYFDSAIPRAFAAGRSIFVSIGLLEMLDDNELKAVLAHEAWHIRQNTGAPYFKRLALMTFSSSESELESRADRFAAEIAGSAALSSARNKVDKVFI